MTISIFDQLLEDGVIDEVRGRLKSGKEADIWVVRRGETILAAKLYKDRDRRNFKSNADYKEGRAVRNSRTRRAIESGSSFGREAEEQEWKTAEADALSVLHAAGVRVPRPIQFVAGVLLMEIVVDADGEPAPRLIDVADLSRQAMWMYRDLRAQMIRMLCAEYIHGDLSAYNILAAPEGPTIIDLPQVVSPSHNSRAEFFFLRDFQNVLQFLGSHDRAVLAYADDGRKIWNAYARRHLTPDFVPSRPGSEPRGNPRENPRGSPRDNPLASGPAADRRDRPAPAGQRPPRPSDPPRPRMSKRVPKWQPPPAALPKPPHPAPQRNAHPPQHAGQPHPAQPRDARAPGGGPAERRRRRRKRRGGAGPGAVPPQNAGSPQGPSAASPRPPSARPPPPRPPQPQRSPRPGAPPRPTQGEPKLPEWLVKAAKKRGGGGGGPRPVSSKEQKPFRRRKRRF